MKKIYFSLLLLLLMPWPQRKSDAREDKPVIETLIKYQKMKYEILNYEIMKKGEKIAKQINLIKASN